MNRSEQERRLNRLVEPKRTNEPMQFQPVQLRGIAVVMLWVVVLLVMFIGGAVCGLPF